MFAVFFVIVTTSQKQLADNPIILDASSDIYASEFIFVTTPHGIYTFDRNAQIWSRITQSHGLPDNDVNIIGLDDGILWVVTETGCASADVRLNDWQTYDLPGITEALIFDDDYVWAAGDYGILRFDKYVEIWEEIAPYKTNHGYGDADYIWFATDSGIIRYNRQFESIKQIVEAPSAAFQYIISTPKRLWFLAPDTFAAFAKSQEHWSLYSGFEINDYSILGDSLFVVTAGTVYLYEPSSDSWQRFRDIEGLPRVNGISAGTEHLLLATDEGLLQYDWETRQRTLFNRSNGLEQDSIIAAYEETNKIFAVSRGTIEFYDTRTALWQAEEIEAVMPRQPELFYLDEAGGHARLITNVDLRLQGWAYYAQSRTISDGDVTTTDYDNVNLRLVGLHTSKRVASAYYDDTDKEQELYGFSYRGLERDLLYEANAGYLNSAYYECDLVPTFSILGGQTKFRHAQHSLDLQAGEIKSQIRKDFFTGKSTRKSVTLFDTGYLNYTFYRIHDHTIISHFDTLFIDDQDALNNDFDTRTEFTIGGITGDFDVFINGQDYFIDYHNAILQVLSVRESSDIIILLLNGEEIVLQSQTIQDHVLQNIYAIGPDIEPHSFMMQIADTLGTMYELSDFGLDQNGDGRVDEQYINYDRGYLTFPSPRPFPDDVYDHGTHIYTMHFAFTTRSLFYNLTHSPVLRNSELVSVDAEALSAGNDYILDYTSGTLLFLREDIVSDFSEIEVQYSSVDRDRTDRLYAIEPNIRIGNTINITPGISRIEDKNIYHIAGRWRTEPHPHSAFKFVPQGAYTDEKNWSHKYTLITHYKTFSLNAAYSGFADSFPFFEARKKKYGSLRQSGFVAASIEPFRYVRLDGYHNREHQRDTSQTEHVVRNTLAKIAYLHPQLPHGYVLISRDNLPTHDRHKMQFNLNYDLHAMNTTMKLNSLVRNIVEETPHDSTQNAFEWLCNAIFSLPFPMNGEFYYRHNNRYTNDTKTKDDIELRTSINFDVIPGMYYRGYYKHELTSFRFDQTQDLDLRLTLNNTLHIAPGRWFRRLSIVNVSCGLSHNLDEYLHDLPHTYRKPFLFFTPLNNGNLSSINRAQSYFVSGQLTPISELLIWAKHTNSRSGIAYYTMPDVEPAKRNEMKIEYEPGNAGLFIASFDHRSIKNYPHQNLFSVYTEWSKPWSSFLRTKLTILYREDEKKYTSQNIQSEEVRANIQTLLRFTSRSFVTVYCGGYQNRTTGTETDHALIPGISANLNLLAFTYVQFDYESTLSTVNPAVHYVSARLTAQF